MKKKYSQIVAISLVTVLLAVVTNAVTLKLSDYATANDGLDDSAGFQQAVNDLKIAGGGTVIVDAGIWDIFQTVNFSTYQNYVSFHIKGDKGAILRPHLGQWNVVFYSGNTNQFEMTDLIVLGDPNVVYDALYIAGGGYTSHFKVSGCQFLGLRVRESIIHVDAATDALIESNLFEGNAADIASIYAYNYRGLTVKNTNFFDYANFRDQYLSKTPENAGPWIKAEAIDTLPAPNANGQRVVRLEDLRFDEGSPIAVSIINAKFVFATGLLDNVSGIATGVGIRFDNVELAEVKMSRFGFTSNPRPAIVAVNNSKVLVTGISIGGGVYYGEADSTSSVIFDERFCSNCSVRLIGQSTKDKK